MVDARVTSVGEIPGAIADICANTDDVGGNLILNNSRVLLVTGFRVDASAGGGRGATRTRNDGNAHVFTIVTTAKKYATCAPEP